MDLIFCVNFINDDSIEPERNLGDKALISNWNKFSVLLQRHRALNVRLNLLLNYCRDDGIFSRHMFATYLSNCWQRVANRVFSLAIILEITLIIQYTNGLLVIFIFHVDIDMYRGRSYLLVKENSDKLNIILKFTKFYIKRFIPLQYTNSPILPLFLHHTSKRVSYHLLTLILKCHCVQEQFEC